LVSKTGRGGMWVRPYYKEFLDYLFRHFEVAVWSSAQPHTVKNMCQLFEDGEKRLLFTWNREHLGLSRQEYHSKVSTIKDLQLVWEYFQKRPTKNMGQSIFNGRNTILLDDSASKAILQPFNSIELSEFNHTNHITKEHGDSELLNVINYLEKVKLEDNVCNFMKVNPYESNPLSSLESDARFICTYYGFQRAIKVSEDIKIIGTKHSQLHRRRGDTAPNPPTANRRRTKGQ
jgi:hypothetical protein